ncbi:MAG: FGGY-family carbohydrate kinase [Sedimentisphaerales bacterium]|jgi:rhamnulokinase
MTRIILENLARKYAETTKQLEDVTGTRLDRLHVVGGGSQNALLNQLTADATGKIITAGPVEATELGNILMQAKATGLIAALSGARALVRRSFVPSEFRLQNPDAKKIS